MQCKLCKEFYKKYPLEERDDSFEKGKKSKVHVLSRHSSGNPSVSSAPRLCAFKDGIFSSDNWGCETMLKLRII